MSLEAPSSPGSRSEVAAWLDRRAAQRRDGDTLSARLAQPDTVIVPMWRNKSLIVRESDGARAALLSVADAAGLVMRASVVCFLGEIEGRAAFAVDLPADRELDAFPELRGELGDLRMIGGLLPPEQAGLLAYARGLLGWHKRHAHCPRCGAAARAEEGGHVRVCGGCGEKHFPRSDPAVMILMVHDDRCLLARQPSFPPGMRSVLAGFVEPGETLEDAVVREAHEEVGIVVREPRYLGSQPWPFPSSLMIGFAAIAENDTIVLDLEELEEAGWYSREAIERGEVLIPPPYSLAHRLIQRFLARDV